MCAHTSIDSLACPSQCYSSENYNMQCPVCSKVFNELADPLPFSHHAQSQLICAMSGEPINEHNPPMALPNGYIYGENVSARGSWLYAAFQRYIWRFHVCISVVTCCWTIYQTQPLDVYAVQIAMYNLMYEVFVDDC